MSESSIYDYGLAAIPILETELLKERSEHQEFRATVAAALRELRRDLDTEGNPEFSDYREGIDYAVERLDTTIAALGLADETQDCPECGNSRQVWRNQITGKMTCHRAGCHKEISK